MKLLSKKQRLAREKEQEDKREAPSAKVPGVETIREDVGSAPPEEKRIRLSCDISKAQHRKLRIHAAETDQSIVEVVVGLIERHCARN